MATNPLVEAMRRQNGEEPYAPASSNVTHGAAFGVYRRPETAGTRPGMMQPYAATGPRSFEPAKSLDAGSMRMNATSDPRSLTFGGATPQPANDYAGVGYRPPAPPSASSASTAAPPAVPAAPPQAPSADFSAVNDFSQAPSPAPAVAPAPAQAATPMAPIGAVTRDGNSYSGPAGISGDITINGKPPGGIMNSLPSGATPGSQMQGIAPGLSTSLGNPLVQAAIAHSGNDWASRNALRNAEVSASSIKNTQQWGGRGAENNPAVQKYQAMLATDQVLQQAAPGLQAEGMRQGNALVRAAMEQQGQNQRAGMQAGLTQQRLDMDRETQGYTNRTNRLVEAARNQVAGEQDPTKRRSLVQYMRDIEGGTPQADPYLVVPGGQQIDPVSQRAYNTPSTVFNRQSGQFVQQPGQAGSRQAPAAGTVEGGWKFRGGDPSDQRNWERA